MNLTDEQIQKASFAAIKDYCRSKNWNDAVAAAAPYLQCPIEPLMKEEIFYALRTYRKESMGDALTEFIDRRNAALFSKPDPRREELESVIETAWKNTGTMESATVRVADAALALFEQWKRESK
jgi:hypothetical protein